MPGAAVSIAEHSRPGLPLNVIAQALATPGVTDGTLLVGLKESTASRGVDGAGVALPVQARFVAEAAVRSAFPEIEVVDGITRVIPGQRGAFAVVDTLYRTFLRVRGTNKSLFSIALLDRLQQHANVDYIAPNYTNGGTMRDVGPTPLSRASLMAETRGWQVDTMRAPSAWALGYTGGSTALGVVDSGYEPSNPDLAFNSSYYNFTAGRSDNSCTTYLTVCYYEEPFHGTGVLGAAVGTQNSVGAVGIAPSTIGANVAKVLYMNGSVQQLPVDIFSDAVIYISNLSSDYGAHTGVAVTSLGYPQGLDSTYYPALLDAFNYGANQGRTLWFAAAGNNTPGGIVLSPASFGNVVAVGSLDRSGGVLIKSSFSPTHSKVELVAPGSNVFIPWNHNDPTNPAYTATESGTSFAAPAAAAVAKMVLQVYPSYTPSQVRQHLQTYARDLGAAGKDNLFGYGMASAYCAVQLISPCTP